MNKQMEENYWLIDNKIIFKPGFNSILNDYIEIISKYNELIFSNYDDVDITLERNNKYVFDTNSEGSKFNQTIKLPESITRLTFRFDFNQPIVLPELITHLFLVSDLIKLFYYS